MRRRCLRSIYLRRGAGCYIDVSASQMIIDGRIRLRSGPARGVVAEFHKW